MAIIKCPECGKEISDKATSCPNCGFPLIKAQPEKEKLKEYTVVINDSMYIQATLEKIKVFYNHNQIIESPVDDFVLNYSKEEPDDFGHMQLKIAFSTPSYNDSFKICINVGSEKYESTKEFLTDIADKYFRKDFVSNWYLVNEYARNHSDKFKSGETNVNIQKTQTNIQRNQPRTASYQQSYEEKKKDSIFASTGFTVFMLLIFWPIGLFTMWKYDHFKKSTKVILTVLCIGLGIFVYNNYSKQAKINRQKEAIQEVLNDTDSFSNVLRNVNSADNDKTEKTFSSNTATVGDSIDADGLKITINDADVDFQDYSNDYGLNTPDAGMKYVRVSFAFENESNSDKYVSIYDFKCYADNQSCEQCYGLDDSNFINTNISSGRTVSFNTYYTVPIDSQSIELEYTTNIWTDEKAIIKLQ